MQTGENIVVSVLGSIFQGMVSHLVRPGSYSKISGKVETDFRIDFCYFTVQSPYALSLSPPTEHSHVTPSKIDNYIHGLIVRVFGKRIFLTDGTGVSPFINIYRVGEAAAHLNARVILQMYRKCHIKNRVVLLAMYNIIFILYDGVFE